MRIVFSRFKREDRSGTPCRATLESFRCDLKREHKGPHLMFTRAEYLSPSTAIAVWDDDRSTDEESLR